jgi:hypothetical protein
MILKSSDPEKTDNECFRADLRMYGWWPTSMATCAYAAFKALWPTRQ